MKFIYQTASQRLRRQRSAARELSARRRKNKTFSQRRRYIIAAVCPASLSFSENREQTMQFFEELQSLVDKSLPKNRKISIDFSKLKNIGLAASVYLVSEFDKLQKARFKKPFVADSILRTPYKVLHILFGLGFFRYIGRSNSAEGPR